MSKRTPEEILSLPNGKYGFKNNLYLNVRGSSRSWFVRYVDGGKRRERSLGKFPDMSLADARIQARLICAQIDAGVYVPPAPKKSASRITPPAKPEKPEAPLFGDVWKAAVENRRSIMRWTNEKAEKQWAATITTYALPVLKNIPVDKITTDDVLKVLAPMWETKTDTAGKLRQRLAIVLNFAKSKGWRHGDNPAEWRGNLDSFLPPITKVRQIQHFRAVDFDYLRDTLVPTLRESRNISYIAILFGILTALRTQEFVRIRWDEISETERTLTVPWKRLKTAKLSRKDMRVPLSNQALQTLQKAWEIDDEKHLPPAKAECVFPGESAATLNLNTPRVILRKITGQEITMHGMRSVFRDWCAREGIDYTQAEKCLGHTVGDKTVQAYLRSDLLEERRIIMQKWADAIMPMTKQHRR